MKKKKFNLITEYQNSFLYIKKVRNFIYWIIGIFFVFALIGFFAPSPEIISNYILEYIKELLETTKNFNANQMMGFIFFNNLKSGFLGLVLGSVFGIFSVFNSLSNGYVLGFVASQTVADQGAVILWRLVPHGIFELPAIFLSLGMGLKLGSCLFKKKNRYLRFRENLINSIKTFLLIVVPLLIIAAIIEAVFIFLG